MALCRVSGVEGEFPLRSRARRPAGEERKKLADKHLTEADFLAGMKSPNARREEAGGDGVCSGVERYLRLRWEEEGVEPECTTFRDSPCRRLTMPRAVSGVPALALAAFLLACSSRIGCNKKIMQFNNS